MISYLWLFYVILKLKLGVTIAYLYNEMIC